jgi:hypothetical protein
MELFVARSIKKRRQPPLIGNLGQHVVLRQREVEPCSERSRLILTFALRFEKGRNCSPSLLALTQVAD